MLPTTLETHKLWDVHIKFIIELRQCDRIKLFLRQKLVYKMAELLDTDLVKKDEKSNEHFSLKRELFEWMEAIVFSLVVVVLLFTFVFRIVGIEGRSMMDTLQDNDRVIITHLFYQPKQNDIVVITKPTSVNRPIIKRVIATGGQKVDIDFDRGIVYVDDKALDEPYIKTPTTLDEGTEFPLTLKDGEVFVMGDNRGESLDSRSPEIGVIDERYILGKAVFRIYPFKSIGTIN